MPQLDKLLSHIVPRGGIRLRMDPDAQPILETSAGKDVPLLAGPLPGAMIEALAREVLPPGREGALGLAGETAFDYDTGTEVFRIQLSRGPGGLRLTAEPSRPAVTLTQPLPRRTGGHALAPADLPPRPPTGPIPGAPSQALLAPAAPRALDPLPSPRPAPEPAPMAASRPAPQAKAQPIYGTHPQADALFQALLDRKASDLHLRSFEAPLVRVAGDLEDLTEFGILGPSQILEMMEALAPAATWRHFTEHNDADFAYPFEAGGCRLRVNYFMDRVGPGVVCRVIPNEIPNPDRLGLPDPVKRLAHLSKGLVLVTGPTGSGKSTTLAAIIDIVNRTREDHILTIEDPIEFVHPRQKCLVTQREVGSHTESFKSGLRAALREDPDVVLVGEMRDLETIAIALETAITGHLVFGTLHTSSAIGTIDRIVDQFPADRQQQIRVMLADALKCVISQTLLKKTTSGRVAALETLFITPAISNLIREGKNFQIPSAMQTGRAMGQKLMNDSLVELIQSRQVDVKEAYFKCPDKETFINSLKRVGIEWDPRTEADFF